MAAKKKKKTRKRKKKIIKTPNRHFMDSEEEYLQACLDAADKQVEQQEDKVLDLVDKLTKAYKTLKDKQAARYRYACRLEKAREQPVKLIQGYKGDGDLLVNEETGRADLGAYIPG